MSIRTPSRAMTVMAALWLGFFPLWQDFTYAHITKTKWIGALALCGITVLVVLALLILCRRPRVHPVQLAALAYFAWVALSAWQGVWAGALNGRNEPVMWMGAIRYEGLLTQLCYMLIFLMLSLYPVHIGAVGTAAAAAVMVFGAIVAVQYTGYNLFDMFPAGRSIYTNYEFQGTIGNIDMCNGYLSLVMPLLMGLFLTKSRGGGFLLAGGFLGAALMWCMDVQSGLIVLALFCGLTVLLMLRFPALRVRGCLAIGAVMLALMLRGMVFLPWLDSATPREPAPLRLVFGMKAALGLCGAAVCGGAALLFRRHPGKAVPAKAILCLVIAAVILVVAAVAWLPIPETGAGLYELHEILNGRMEDHYGSWRFGAWRHTLEMSADRLLFGNGPDAFYYAMKDHLAAEGAVLGENFDNPHNEYLAILSNNGLPAMLLYLVLLGMVLWLSCRQGRWALALSIGCYAVQGIFCFSICLVTPMFWAVMGMAAAQLAEKEQAHVQPCAEVHQALPDDAGAL